jgi:hypothetical protein
MGMKERYLGPKLRNIDKKLSINPRHFLAQRRQDAKKTNFYSKTFAALRLGARIILLPS